LSQSSQSAWLLRQRSPFREAGACERSDCSLPAIFGNPAGHELAGCPGSQKVAIGEHGTSAQGGKLYLGLALEFRLWPKLRSFPARPCRGALRAVPEIQTRTRPRRTRLGIRVNKTRVAPENGDRGLFAHRPDSARERLCEANAGRRAHNFFSAASPHLRHLGRIAGFQSFVNLTSEPCPEEQSLDKSSKLCS
jgi:hypothetical protein